ncbi:MAG: UbiA family prenyltransferase [Candidatus Aenigmatarchaeota archaeon]
MNDFLQKVVEIREFVRAETGMFAAGIALSGYFLYNELSMIAIFVFLTAFFSSCAIYSYNHRTDKEEDRINNNGINPLSIEGKGILITILCLAASFGFSLFLSFASFIIYLISISSGMLYSTFRLKKYYFIKNFYAGVVFSLPFLMGETAYGFSYEMLNYLPVPFLSGFAINLLGDIRGFNGDLYAGLKTLPVIAGMEWAKNILHGILYLIVFLSLVCYPFFVYLAPFMVTLSIFLIKNDMKITRACMIFSFATLPAFILVMKWI